MTENANLHLTADPDVVRAWVAGWVISRRVAPPVSVPGGFRIDVGLPGHVVRYVLPRPDLAVLRALSETITAPGTWLKACAPRDLVAPSLTADWTVKDPEFMMTTSLTQDHMTPPNGYSVDLTRDSGVTIVRAIAAGGHIAASGRMACAGSTAVLDQISTDAAHRRRGLARLVMSRLGGDASEQGAVRGVLVSTVEGFALYQALGWTLHVPVTAAVRELPPSA